MSGTVLLPISDGFEEIEAATIIDVLRRADVEVTVASLKGDRATGRSGITMIADAELDAALLQGPYEMIVLPGGLPNAYTLRDDRRVTDAVAKTYEEGRHVAAICAAPAALVKAGVLTGKKATNYPGLKSDLPDEIHCEDNVVESDRVITSRGPATAMEFALTLARILAGPEVSKKVAKDVLATT